MSRRIAAFIRHAEYHQLVNTPSALQPFALTEMGVAQSKKAAIEIREFLQQNQWQLDASIHSSSSLRAWQTAQILKEQLQDLFAVESQLDSFDALTERSVGSVANLTTKQIEQVIKDDPRFEDLPVNWKSDSYAKLPFQGAESLFDAGERVAQHLINTMSEMAMGDGDVVKLFVGHGASFRHAAYKLGVIDFEQIAALSMHHAKPIYLAYQSDDTWTHIAGDWKVRAKKSEYTD